MFRPQAGWLPVIGLVTAMALWGGSFIALKSAFQTFDPMLVIFGRMVVACFCFLFLGKYLRGNVYRKGDLKYILFMVSCEPCLYFIFEAKAVENTTASQAGMVKSVLPLLVAFAARIFLKEVISRRTWCGFFIAMAGVCWLSAGGEPTESAPHPALGNFLEFAAMVCAAAYSVTLKKLTSRYNPFFLTAVQAFAGSLFFSPVLLSESVELSKIWQLTPILCVIYLGAFVTLGAYGLYNYALSRMPANQASAYINLVPVFAVSLAWVFLGERFTGEQYLASALVFLGVFLSQEESRNVFSAVPQWLSLNRPSPWLARILKRTSRI